MRDSPFDGAEEYGYVRMLEPHKTGYAHVHLGILTPRDVGPADFQPVLNSFLKNCELAGEAAHEVVPMREQARRRERHETGELAAEHLDANGNPELGCVSVLRPEEQREGVGAYLGSYLSQEFGDGDETGRLGAEAHLQRFWALLWATGRKRFVTSTKANELMRRDLRRGWGEERELAAWLRELIEHFRASWEMKGVCVVPEAGETPDSADEVEFYETDPGATKGRNPTTGPIGRGGGAA